MLSKKYGEKVASILQEFGEDGLKLPEKYGDDLASIIDNLEPTEAKKAVSLINSYGDDALEMFKEGKSFDEVKKIVESGSKAIGIDELVVRDTKFLDVDGNIDWEKWAPNGGRVPGTIKENQTITTGTIIDRYGSQWGKYTSPVGVPYEQRALPYIENPNAYHKYEVLKPIDNVTISEIAPAFEQVGGGIQYELPYNIKKLKELGYIKEIK